MKRQDEITRLHRLLTLKHQKPLSLARIQSELDHCSASTAKRVIRDLRERFGHPVKYDRERGGYFYDHDDPGDGSVELPGLWFTESEMRALLTMRRLLADLEPGLFDEEIAPLGRRVEEILEHTGADPGEVARRIRVLAMARRPVAGLVFRTAADAVLRRRRMRFLYKSRSRPGDPEHGRDVSPQRLVHYRDNWYLDGWCHEQNALRIFALDQMREPSITDETAHEVDVAELDRVLKSGYGIFAGEASAVAVLRFTPERAQWVSKEQWHPAQEGRLLEDGAYELRLPYSRPEELVMDVLKHGPHVEVVEPAELREQVAKLLAAASARY
jgi:predicted DNA-binding transcriptional regulator YafY